MPFWFFCIRQIFLRLLWRFPFGESNIPCARAYFMEKKLRTEISAIFIRRCAHIIASTRKTGGALREDNPLTLSQRLKTPAFALLHCLKAYKNKSQRLSLRLLPYFASFIHSDNVYIPLRLIPGRHVHTSLIQPRNRSSTKQHMEFCFLSRMHILYSPQNKGLSADYSRQTLFPQSVRHPAA